MPQTANANLVIAKRSFLFLFLLLLFFLVSKGHLIGHSVTPPYCLWPLVDEALASTEKLWLKEYGCAYLWKDKQTEQIIAEVKTRERVWNEEDSPVDEHFENDTIYLASLCMDEEDRDIESEAEAEAADKKKFESYAKFLIEQKPPDAKCPFQLRVEEVIRDRAFFACVDGYGFTELNFDLSVWLLAEKMYEKWLYLQCLNPSKQLETTFLIDLAMRAHMCHPIVRKRRKKKKESASLASFLHAGVRARLYETVWSSDFA